jgi:hypothetical protein
MKPEKLGQFGSTGTWNKQEMYLLLNFINSLHSQFQNFNQLVYDNVPNLRSDMQFISWISSKCQKQEY